MIAASADSALAYLPLAEAGARIAARELSPVELTQAMLDRITALNPRLHAYYSVFADEALSAARAAEREIQSGRHRGPLHGVPIAVKDIYETGPTTGGSRVRKDYVAQQDCTVVSKLKQHGAVLLGKLATYEFAAGMPTLSSHFPPARNPWNTALNPGGSSSGAGVALAAGLAFGAMGTDTGGSIRYPAFCCGVVGLKPTYGRVSRAGVFPLSWNLDHTGPMARAVRDCALMLQACAGYDARDPASARAAVPDFSARLGRDLHGLRIGIPRRLFADSCAPEILAAFEPAVLRMSELGAAVSDIDSVALDELLAVFWTLACADAAAYHLHDLRERPAEYESDMRLLLALGTLISASAYVQAERVREQIRREMLRQLDSIDLFMLPTIGMMPRAIRAQSRGFSILAGRMPLYTALFNLSGFPALALPCGFSPAGLPIGFQLAGRPFEEPMLLQAGHA
ncbi:MAG: amidase, partial [Candidatus Binatia bacterium]